MATLNISMPDEVRVSMGEYQSAGDYLRELIRHDHEATEQLLLESMENGTARTLDMTALKKRFQSLLKPENGR